VFEVLTQCFSIVVHLVLVYSVKDQEAIFFRNILVNIILFWFIDSDRFLPDKAIDLIDEAGSRVRLRHAQVCIYLYFHYVEKAGNLYLSIILCWI
jgi:hypothetical protein